MRAVFTGYDSAWGADNKGAICELVLQDEGSLLLKDYPVCVSWNDAIGRARRNVDGVLNIWAIDQPICVANESGCRPVEVDLARDLMADFGCGAYPSNLSNPCWTPSAPIWDLLRTLAANEYHHQPMAIPAAQEGRHYFECYPHPAILGLFDLNHVLKYKFRHHDRSAWRCLIMLLQRLASADLPITNVGAFVTEQLAQNKDNENKLDAIICAYVAAYWWKYGTKRSTMIGDTTTGYIVTPHNDRTRRALAEVFSGRLNMQGDACAPPKEGLTPVPTPLPTETMPAEPLKEWFGPVTLRATDTTNIWRNSRGVVINRWMGKNKMVGWNLWVRFFQEDGKPAVLFVPFANQGQQQGGMKSTNQQMNRQLWHMLVAEARRSNPIDFQVLYKYERI
jgi:predicted RNase H-like nuclease